jgi:succinate dehydrogenase / fumarate reductase membrane anchor subunit
MADAVKRLMAETPDQAISRFGLWPWFLQRVTAALLPIALGTHIWALHFVSSGERLTFQSMRARLASPLILSLDGALLALALFHGLNGVRMVALDFNIGPRAERWLTAVLWVVGLLTFVFGLNTLVAFLYGNPWFTLR